MKLKPIYLAGVALVLFLVLKKAKASKAAGVTPTVNGVDFGAGDAWD